MSTLRPRIQAVVLISAACLGIAACSSGATIPTFTPNDKVSIQLSWTHDFSLAAFYTAEKNHHFQEQNLTANLVEGGFSGGKYIVPIDQVVNNTVDFGMSSASDLLIARAEGKPVVGLATIFQRSPLAIITLAKNNIRRPQDLIGKRVTVADGGATQVYTTLLTSQGIDPAKVTLIPRTTDGIDPLINGDVDALVGWVINEGVQVREAGQQPSFMLMSDYGVDSYDFVLFTSDQMLKTRPDLCERLLRAITSGLKDEVANPDQAVSYVLNYGKGLDSQGQNSRLQASIPLINPPGTKLGMMTDSNWAIAYKILLDQKIISTAIDYKTAYTLQVLNKIYG
jgi:NitT/TauT family transport system substrate-binding protein